MDGSAPIDPLISSLSRRAPLTSKSETDLRSLSIRVREFRPNHDLVASGSRPRESCVVVSGFAARAQYLPDGGRQLDAIHIPGDFVDLHSLHLQRMDHSVAALGPCVAGFIPHSELISLMRENPQLTWLFWQSTVMDAAIARAWIACLGRKLALESLAHLVCELCVRLRSAGQVTDAAFYFPATQHDVADMVGLSHVHVNRTLKELRTKALLEWEAQRVHVLDFDALAAIAGFDGAYLRPGRPMPRNAPQLA